MNEYDEVEDRYNRDERPRPNPNETFGWLAKAINLLRRYGIKDILMGVMVLFLVIIVGMFVANPESFVKKINESQQRLHNEAIEKRIKSEPQIRECLLGVERELKCDRVFILETHNGGSNLSNLPFIYVDLTYAEPKSDLTWMEVEYKNVRLSRYPWATELYATTMWAEPIEGLKELDPELYYRLEKEGVKYMAAIMLYGTYNPSGVLGVCYCDNPNIPSDLEIKKVLYKYSGQLSQLLNNE